MSTKVTTIDEGNTKCPILAGGDEWLPRRLSRVVTKSVNGGFDMPIEVVGGARTKSGSTVEKALKRLFTRGAYDDDVFNDVFEDDALQLDRPQLQPSSDDNSVADIMVHIGDTFGGGDDDSTSIMADAEIAEEAAESILEFAL